MIERIGKLQPANRRTGQHLHRPLLLLWAIAQAVHGRPRQQSWSTVHEAVGPLLATFAGAAGGPQDVLYPFWALQRNQLWEVENSTDLPLTSQGRRPKLSALDQANPLAGLPKDDYDRLAGDLELAAWAVSTLLTRFFHPLPPSFLESLGLQELMAGRIADRMRPHLGETYPNRNAIADVYGGNRVLGITPLADGVLTVYSDDKGPYADQRIPETNWIAYTGDGLSGDQTLTMGNRAMAEYQEQQKALRYWHKPYKGHWTFETWAVIIQRRRRWGRGQDGQQRREYVWILAPVPSPMRETWPLEFKEALLQDDGQLHDDSLDVIPVEVDSAPETAATSAREKYKQLSAAAQRTAAGRTRQSKLAQVERYLRSPAAREAVILRSEGRCENPSCMGHPHELTDADQPILEVDHVNGLARTGQDVPEVMIALCPNCHALKTRGKNRRKLQEQLLVVARSRHRTFLPGS
ncbi:HNH endonuclease signature motif containing protein [Allostreptomyces psammosilenae]|uniref:5-methylcytosine-specific restriction protein A n=1 Tax=Allostreptomyces psammosilenae TaxID=1892865 RepID=A0A852ZXE2_9ACTN|nr:HNH endonuclease signature motif containing protein [Allostreptomyces psammosilenae]NYI06407.1 5-methylcytosine-specific restriction protein A [Allostreptomyces psammosilenae]